MRAYLKLMRVSHYLKNGLIFLPLLFSKNLFNKNYFYITVLGFIVFSILSSIIYINNDIQDVENDKKHSVKKFRPLASGEITISKARRLEALLSFIFIVMLCTLYKKTNNSYVILLPILYVILNILYSKSLKNIAILDVVILVSGFLIRVLFGSIIISVKLSNWLYLMIIFGSFYLGFGKRRNEIQLSGSKSRKVLTSYNKDFLDKNMYSCFTLSIFSYSMWCIDPLTCARLNNNFLVWTVPIVMIIFMMYSLELEGRSFGDPVEIVLKNKKLMTMIGVYGIIMFLILYVF